MKKPITTIIFVLFSILFGGCSAGCDHTQERRAGQSDVIALACDPIPVVRVGFIGLGLRGIGAVGRFMYLDSVEAAAFCDPEGGGESRTQPGRAPGEVEAGGCGVYGSGRLKAVVRAVGACGEPSVEIPGFTRGAWKKTDRLEFADVR